MLAICDAGCKEQFTVDSMNTRRMGKGIEKTSFTCPHCHHEYAAFYTNMEIRQLQEELWRTGRFAGMKKDEQRAMWFDLKAEPIKQKMIALRQRMEDTL